MPSRCTSARAWRSHDGASENAHGGIGAADGSQIEWSAESPADPEDERAVPADPHE